LIQIPVHVFECEPCILTFTVEMAFEDQAFIKCPNCAGENIKEVGSSEIVIAPAATEAV